MATVGEYQIMLERATEAGDTPAMEYFNRQLMKGLKPKPPQGGNILDPISQGLTFGFADELGGTGAGLLSMAKGEGFGKGYGDTTKHLRKRASEYAERHPYISTAAEIGSGLMLPFGALRSGASGLKTAMGSGAAYGAGMADTDTEGDILDSLTKRLEGSAWGAGTGAAGYGLLRGVLPKRTAQASKPSHQANVNLLSDVGVGLSAGTTTARPAARMAERTIANTLSAGGVDEGAQKIPLMRKLMEKAGFDPEDIATGDLSKDAVERAKASFNSQYSDALSKVKVKMSDLDPRLQAFERRWYSMLPNEQAGQVQRIVTDLRSAAGSGKVISGEDYKRIRSVIGKRAHQASKSDVSNYLAEPLRDLRRAMDEAFRKAAPKAKQKLLNELDRKYGGFKVLQKGSDNPNAVSTMANEAKRNATRIGDPEFVDLLHAYQEVVERGYPRSSGTAENLGLFTPFRAANAALQAGRAQGRRSADAIDRIAARLGIKVPENAGAFVAGQQSPNSSLEDVLRALGQGSR